MEQDLRDEGASRSPHVVHVLPSNDQRLAAIVRAQVERIETATPEGPARRLLVLVPSADDAARVAGTVNDGLDASGALLTPVADTTRGARRITSGGAAIVTTPSLARDLLRQSVLKLDGVQGVVLLDLDALIARDGATLDEVLAELPKGADRIAVTPVVTAEVDAFLERHARKARRMQYEALPASDATMQYVVCDRSGRARILSDILDTLDPRHATIVAAEEDAEAACGALAHLGYGPEDPMVTFSDGDVPEGEELVILYTAPADAEDLQPVLEGKPTHLVALVSPEELSAFQRAFPQSATAALPSAAGRRAASNLEALRDAAAAALKGSQLHHELVALAPLFARHDPAEVAAALLALLERQPAVAPAVSAPAQRAAAFPEARPPRPAREEYRPDRGTTPSRERAERPAASGAYTPVFVNVGMRDGAQKGDLVGALTNESGISSDMLGKITMRDVFSVVEIDASVAERVIESITGKTIRGRVVNARVDRKPEERSDERRSGERPLRRSVGTRGPRDDSRSPRGRSRDSFGGAREGRGFAGGGRPTGERNRSTGDRSRPSGDRGRPAGERSRPREEFGGPRPFRENDRGTRGPRAIGESREWGERGERLKHARRPRRDHE